MVLLRRADGELLTATVLLLAATTGYQIRSFGEAAARLGVRLVFASDRCDRLDDPWWDEAIPVRFHDEASSREALRVALAAAPPDGILAVGDRPTVLAAQAARLFGLPGHPPEAAAASRNKLATREAFRRAGLPTPWFEPIPIESDVRTIGDRVPYPAVLKPLSLSGSRGVMRVNNPGELAAGFDRLRRLLASPDVRAERDEAHEMAMIESFVPGAEYAVEALLDRGRLTVLAIFDKPDPLDGPFFEETIYVTPSRAPHETQRRIGAAVGTAAAALGLWHGPIHAECRLDGSEVYVLEVAARPIGGLCSRALRFGDRGSGIGNRESGIGDRRIPLEELLLRHALGHDLSGAVREADASGVMMIPIPKRGIYRRVEGEDRARAVPGIDDVRITAKPDAAVVPLPEGRSYLGFIFARTDRPAQAEQALREAHAHLSFTIERDVVLARAPD